MLVQAGHQQVAGVALALAVQADGHRLAHFQLHAVGQLDDRRQVELGGDLRLGEALGLEQMLADAFVAQRDVGAHRVQLDAQARLPLVVDLAVHDQEAADFRKGSVLGGDETESRRLVVQVPGGLDRQGQEGQAEADQLVHAGSLCVRRHLKPAAWEQANSRVSRARAATD